MSALPIQHLPVEEQQAEVIYLVVPPTTMAQTVARPFSMAEHMASMFYSLQMRTRSASEKSLALSFALFVTLVAGLWAYNLKSAIGIDIFPNQHIENFGPFPGWQR